MNKLIYHSDNEVQSQLAPKYDLLVNIGLETFQYAIIDRATSEAKEIAEFELPSSGGPSELIKAIKDLPQANRQFKFAFNNVKISIYNTDFTFIPESLYREVSLPEYGKYINFSESQELFVNDIRSAELKNVAVIHSELKTALNGAFFKSNIYNQAVPFLEGVQKILRKDDQSVFAIDIQPRHFQIAFYSDLKLQFYNTFEYENFDEFNYYLLSTIKSFDVNSGEAGIIVSGKISKQDEVYQRVEKYFGDIRFLDSDPLKKYAARFKEILPHTFFTLFSLDLCE